VTPECSGSTSRNRLDWNTSTGATSYDVYRTGIGFITSGLGSGVRQYLDTQSQQAVPTPTTSALIIRQARRHRVRNREPLRPVRPATLHSPIKAHVARAEPRPFFSTGLSLVAL
jgi:hypothetical protein